MVSVQHRYVKITTQQTNRIFCHCQVLTAPSEFLGASRSRMESFWVNFQEWWRRMGRKRCRTGVTWAWSFSGSRNKNITSLPIKSPTFSLEKSRNSYHPMHNKSMHFQNPVGCIYQIAVFTDPLTNAVKLRNTKWCFGGKGSKCMRWHFGHVWHRFGAVNDILSSIEVGRSKPSFGHTHSISQEQRVKTSEMTRKVV